MYISSQMLRGTGMIRLVDPPQHFSDTSLALQHWVKNKFSTKPVILLLQLFNYYYNKGVEEN